MDHSPIRQTLIELGKLITNHACISTAGKNILNLVKLWSLVAKYRKIWKIQSCEICEFWKVYKIRKLHMTVFSSFYDIFQPNFTILLKFTMLFPAVLKVCLIGESSIATCRCMLQSHCTQFESNPSTLATMKISKENRRNILIFPLSPSHIEVYFIFVPYLLISVFQVVWGGNVI